MLEETVVVSAATGAPFAPRENPGIGAPRIVRVTSSVASEARNIPKRCTRAPTESDDTFRWGLRKKTDDHFRKIIRPDVPSARPVRRFCRTSRQSVKRLELSGFPASDPR